ncbi:MAG: hypothetical protein R3C44_25065, partial [Chloroflexota bacterium]
MKRYLAPFLTVVLIVAVGAAIYFSVRDQFAGRNVEAVTGVVGSEKIPFFSDERVQEAFRRNGLDVQVQKAGSREIATSYDLSEYDFAFPAGVPAAEKLQRENGISKSYNVFFTPMAIASWRTIGDVLVDNGIATDEEGYYIVDMDALLQLMSEEKRWEDLADNDAFSVGRSILVNSTDVRTSNSAAMYLALASYAANNDRIVESLDDARPLMPFLEDLFLRQGFRPSSSSEPFEDYLVKGMGHSPLVMIYEAQFISSAAQENGGITSDMALMYPRPTIFTKHVLIPLSEAGERVGEALMTDPDLQKLAIEYGFRNNDTAYFRDYTSQHQVQIPDT